MKNLREYLTEQHWVSTSTEDNVSFDTPKSKDTDKDDEVKLIKGTWEEGTVEYHNKRLKIKQTRQLLADNYEHDSVYKNGLFWGKAFPAFPHGYNIGF